MQRPFLLAAALGALVAGCVGDTVASAACPFAGDGVCDEPRNCRLGTDEADCAAACRRGVPANLGAACAFRGVYEVPPRPPVPAAAGSHGTGGPTGTWDGTIAARGTAPGAMIQRHYRVYVPPSYDPSRPTPLLYVLGGFRVSVYDLASYTELERTADQNHFIVAFLEADWRNFGGNIGWVWGWYVYTNEWRPGTWDTNPDVDFVRVLTASLERQYNVDRTRIFASGHSRGGGESIILAFELPDLIAGYCSQSGFAHTNRYDARIRAYRGERRVPGVIIHGEADPDVPFREAQRLDELLRDLGWTPDQDYLFLPLPEVTHRWQPWLNQTFWDFLYAHPLPLERVRR